MPLTEEQYQRYARHLVLPGVGMAGQERLLQSRVAVVGAGGLGSAAVLYLAAAGVGTIDLFDPDVVVLSNLQRQVLHRQDELDRPKVESARRAIAALNSDIRLIPHHEAITSENALDALRACDVVVDGCDRFATRYLLNDACYFLGKPFIFAALERFRGQASTFFPGRKGFACYRCLFPDPPPPESIRPCAEAGVLGVLPGILGVLEAAECIKALLGIGRPLMGRLMAFDALEMSWREIPYTHRADCPLCGSHPSISELQPDEGPASQSCEPPIRRT